MNNPFSEECFQNGIICFTIREKPVSSQNKNEHKVRFKSCIRKITSACEFIITSTCWVHIDYYSSNFQRFKNPGVYDMDNIVKPILDGLIGVQGVILDDVLIDRVTVNWIDTPHNDHFDINLQYPNLIFERKDNFVLVKSKSGWCFPASKQLIKTQPQLIKNAFELWEKVQNEDDYYEALPRLPAQNFVHYSKVKDKDYIFIELSCP